MKTLQQTYDSVVEHLATQKRRSHNDHSCKYRSKDGLKCAIGALIPDSLYNPLLEGYSVGNIWEGLSNDAVERPQVFQAKEKIVNYFNEVIDPQAHKLQYFLLKLQHAHDWSTSVSDIHFELSQIASAYDLNADKINSIIEWN